MEGQEAARCRSRHYGGAVPFASYGTDKAGLASVLPSSRVHFADPYLYYFEVYQKLCCTGTGQTIVFQDKFTICNMMLCVSIFSIVIIICIDTK